MNFRYFKCCHIVPLNLYSQMKRVTDLFPVSLGEAVTTRPTLPLPRLARDRNTGRGKGND